MLPIRRVVLYKHGVGYFERENEVEGDATIELQFKSDEMNDVLKSLTVLDLSGGVVSSISYESTKPIEKQLEDIAIKLQDRKSLTGLLSQVKGAAVEIETPSGKITGIITGIEDLSKSQDNTIIFTYLLTLLVNGKTLKSFDILDIKEITFLDENLQEDLVHLLEILISAKKKDAKSLTIYANGDGTRTIIATYVVETPVWKASYRVLLNEEKPMIQGWALVDNTQDEDWKNVKLTLVAGLPISFVHDLYSPRYKKRPIVQVQEEEAYAPPMLEEGMAPPEPQPEAMYDMCESEASMGYDSFKSASRKMAAEKPAPKKSRAEARAVSTQVQTRTVEVGDLFQYEITNPVTVKRNQSALVPILQTSFDGKRVAVYNEEIRDKNPLSSMLIKNTTGLTLEGGPVTVMENETYVGESMLDTLKPDEEKIVPYSVELGCFITSDKESDRKPYHSILITGGYMYLYYYLLEKKVYRIKNKTKKKIDLFLEHRFNHGWDLVETPKPYETTENFHRFRFDVEPEKTMEFTVLEKNKLYESHSVRDIDTDQFSYWSSSGYFDEDSRHKLEELIKLTSQIDGLESQINEYDEEIEEIREDQERLRENLKALGDSKDERKLKERYVAEFTTGEDRLKKLKQSIKDLRDNEKDLEILLSKAIEAIRLEKEI